MDGIIKRFSSRMLEDRILLSTECLVITRAPSVSDHPPDCHSDPSAAFLHRRSQQRLPGANLPPAAPEAERLVAPEAYIPLSAQCHFSRFRTANTINEFSGWRRSLCTTPSPAPTSGTLGMANLDGHRILDIAPVSPAAVAGLKSNVIILQLQRQDVRSFHPDNIVVVVREVSLMLRREGRYFTIPKEQGQGGIPHTFPGGPLSRRVQHVARKHGGGFHIPGHGAQQRLRRSFDDEDHRGGRVSGQRKCRANRCGCWS